MEPAYLFRYAGSSFIMNDSATAFRRNYPITAVTCYSFFPSTKGTTFPSTFSPSTRREETPFSK